MKELLIVFILAMIITPIIATFNIFNLPQEQSKKSAKKPFNISRKISANPGIVGCLSKESLKEIAKFSAEKNSAKMKEIVDAGLCLFFTKSQELLIQEDSCAQEKDGEIFVFKINGSESEFYLPCFAIK